MNFTDLTYLTLVPLRKVPFLVGAWLARRVNDPAHVGRKQRRAVREAARACVLKQAELLFRDLLTLCVLSGALLAGVVDFDSVAPLPLFAFSRSKSVHSRMREILKRFLYF